VPADPAATGTASVLADPVAVKAPSPGKRRAPVVTSKVTAATPMAAGYRAWLAALAVAKVRSC
jgi:hypothetical protein